MELRLDRLLADLRSRTEEILAAIDSDPLLLKRETNGLVLANATKTLYTPQVQHQLYAKGIVYQRGPYRLVSLPLIKIYNLGERAVNLDQLTELTQESGVRVQFTRKIDGSLIQVFSAQNRVWFTTRGMIEGAQGRFDPEDEDRVADFDFLAEARALAETRYPALLRTPQLLAGKTLLFELIHPGARKITSYGERADLLLLGVFDHERFAYLCFEEMQALGQAHALGVVEALSPPGSTLAEQIEGLLRSLAGTDEEGSVLQFERASSVIYRVKVKSPDYLHLLKLMTSCTYERTVEILDTHPQLISWGDLVAFLQEQGRDRIPEEVLHYYQMHYETFQEYLQNCERLREWARGACAEIDAQLGGRASLAAAAYRKAFAAVAVRYPCSGLLFSALDGRLDRARLRKSVRDPAEAREMLAQVGRAPSQSGG